MIYIYIYIYIYILHVVYDYFHSSLHKWYSLLCSALGTLKMVTNYFNARLIQGV